jgi:hypothetical protein
MSRLWGHGFPPPHNIHAFERRASPPPPGIHPSTRSHVYPLLRRDTYPHLAQGHVSASCGRARIPSCGRARVHACHKKPGRRPNRSAEGWSGARRAKRQIYCLCFCFLRFRPKNPCQAPKFPNPLPTKNIRLSYELPSNRYTRYRSKNNRELSRLQERNLLKTRILDITHLL